MKVHLIRCTHINHPFIRDNGVFKRFEFDSEFINNQIYVH